MPLIDVIFIALLEIEVVVKEADLPFQLVILGIVVLQVLSVDTLQIAVSIFKPLGEPQRIVEYKAIVILLHLEEHRGSEGPCPHDILVLELPVQRFHNCLETGCLELSPA